MNNRQQIKQFVLAGNALFTLKSLKTGEHFTFKVQQATKWSTKEQKAVAVAPPAWHVKVLTGPDNSRNYKAIGLLRNGVFAYRLSTPRCESATAFNWFWRMLTEGSQERFVEQCQFHHAGRCGRCGRLLTVPSSIESGIGPECQDKLDFEAAGGLDGLLSKLFGGS